MVFGYMAIERGGTRGGWFFFLMHMFSCTWNFSPRYVNGRTDVPFYSVNRNLNTFYTDSSRSVDRDQVDQQYHHLARFLCTQGGNVIARSCACDSSFLCTQGGNMITDITR